MNKKYNPLDFEEQIYKNWMEKGYFHAEVDKSKKPFTIVMPPPNVTSKLHMGHAFQQTIQDIIIRRKRMQGYNALWLPGTDHAAIATEAKVVEKLKKEGLTKEQIGREAFAERIADWYREYKGNIINQFKRMGFSCDWDRLAFTMDEGNSRAVRQVFCHLYNKGYIYKGKRMVNWCPTCHTSISDAEVEYKDNNSFIWHLRYQIEGTDKYIELATTRPETMLGDTAVAVNPEDDRYRDLVGKNVILPILNKPIPIIADDYVDIEFGTGVVKITPAHDPNDFEVGLRHGLQNITVIDESGCMTADTGKYAGLDRYVAREQIVEDLKKLGNLVKIEPYANTVGHCERCHSVIEPMLSNQWFVKMSELAKPAIKVVEDGEITFSQEKFKKIYLNWLYNIRDWCISRQLWSGHKIPIFTCEDCGNTMVEMTDPDKCSKCGSTHIHQETDTLDTWFSSALWPLSTLGYPDKTPELDYFYPTDVLVTAQEIIQLWVVRMIFSGLEYTGKIPFRKVLINGTVKDAHGKKMSKSLGNGVDPVSIIENYGVDTLRFSLFNGVSIGEDCKFSEKKVELTRNFINKIWNASLFVLHAIEGKEIHDMHNVKLNFADKYILNKLNDTIANVNKSFEAFDLGIVASTLYDFFWTEFCDWYIEIAKVNMAKGEVDNTVATLYYVLNTLLKALHPFIPFITEEIYQNLPKHGESIMIDTYPEYDEKLHFEDANEYETIQDVIKFIRNTRNSMNVPDNQKIASVFVNTDAKHMDLMQSNLDVIARLTKTESVQIGTGSKDDCVASIINFASVYIPKNSLIDEEKEHARLMAEYDTAVAELKRAEGKLNNAGFVAKAPAKLIDEEKAKVAKYTAIIADLKNLISK